MTMAIIAIAMGVAGGFIAALAGVGGGILFVPALALVLGLTQVMAEATSLLAIVPVAVLGTWSPPSPPPWWPVTSRRTCCAGSSRPS